MAITRQQLLENLDLALKNKDEFYELYKNLIQTLVPSKGRYKVTLKKEEIENESNKIISFYKDVFRKKCGPILMDLGYVKDQGQFMEYYKTSKPITFLGINSCLGVVVKGKGGVHLVMPVGTSDYGFYFLRLGWLKAIAGTDDLIVVGDNKEDMDIHLEILSSHVKTYKDKELYNWFKDKIENVKNGNLFQKVDNQGKKTI